jgi:hypothetical protein
VLSQLGEVESARYQIFLHGKRLAANPGEFTGDAAGTKRQVNGCKSCKDTARLRDAFPPHIHWRFANYDKSVQIPQSMLETLFHGDNTVRIPQSVSVERCYKAFPLVE